MDDEKEVREMKREKGKGRMEKGNGELVRIVNFKYEVTYFILALIGINWHFLEFENSENQNFKTSKF